MHFNFNIKCLGKKRLSFVLPISLALPISIITQKPITAYGFYRINSNNVRDMPEKVCFFVANCVW